MARNPTCHCRHGILHHIQHLSRQEASHSGINSAGSALVGLFRRAYTTMGLGASRFCLRRVHTILESRWLAHNWTGFHGWPPFARLHLNWSRLGRSYVGRDKRCFSYPSESYFVGGNLEWDSWVCHGYQL